MTDQGKTEEAQRAVHEALKGFLEEGDIPISWTLTIDILSPGGRTLLHRAGGGIDGTENPVAWQALGMLRSSMKTAERQILDATCLPDDEPEDHE